MKTQNEIPAILTANTYFWTPSSSASARRKNEERRLNEVSEFFKTLGGFTVENTGSKIIASNDALNVVFSYSESCNHVYKSLEVYKGDKKSNITAIKKLLA